MKKSNAMYMSGNGKTAAVYQNGNILRVFGPPYSSPTCFEMKLEEEVSAERVWHEQHAGIWYTTLNKDGTYLGILTDFTYSCGNAIVRRVTCEDKITLRFQPYQANKGLMHYERVTDNSVLIKTQNGNPVYNDYPLPYAQFFKLTVTGDAVVRHVDEFTYDIEINGIGDIIISGGPSYPECDGEEVKAFGEMLEETRAWWNSVFARVSALGEIPKNFPRYDELIYAIESTVINVTVQQGADGGVIAGECFPFCYVRDQYGVCMYMLSVGLTDEARRMLNFYVDVFRKNGKILNAQASGVDGLFHVAENDKTEITGYLLLQFFKFAQKTGDYSLINDNLDFMKWLYLQQESQIFEDMLPFNGDETYIAGELLPRDVLNDGSSEATMLFILSSQLLIDHLGKNEETERMQAVVDRVKGAYHKNFVKDGKYIINNPKRLEGLKQPDYRFGVCMNLGKGDCEFFGWTKHVEGDVYLCPKCIANGLKLQRKYDYYNIPSALLLPAFVDSKYPDKEITLAYINSLCEKMSRDGYFYSNEITEKNIGYDYGLLLFNLIKYELDGKEAVYNKILDLIDEVGTWSERYERNWFDGVRYRPWESAINIAALMEYVRYLKNLDSMV